MSTQTYYELNKEVRINYQRAYDQAKAAEFNRMWRANECTMCKKHQSELTETLHWHHCRKFDGIGKLFNINWKDCKNRSDVEILKEVLKCDSLCNSCHAKTHKAIQKGVNKNE